ncbi:mycofactocin biosynthesis glycosyltransferase MftF [Nocardioides sp. BP30]|uniref:mycofactocin biosynthesis glycosyltransferase MftF n=1 Tax=Nocardioides sp. BP30 TaxID=3036374 RepID=UPI002468AB42|nr:mycofactocin biosynthesis glycosyltransferase MftF [Nocardioides sp. BP30]WGL54125.1 mycofactocin biosynthesis glycosyltransferase MftF [Nocardioides sp. BP30]
MRASRTQPEPVRPTGGPGSRPLPGGFRVRLRDDVARYPGATPGESILIGGSPARSIKLSARAAAMLEGPVLGVTDSASGVLARRLLDANVADPELGDGVDPAEVTVVVPVRDRAEQLDRCLTALAGLRVVVVDDASREPDAVHAVVRRHRAQIVALPTNLGPAGARNAGLRQVTTPLVAFVDSDVTADAAALRGLAAHFADPALAVVGPLVRGSIASLRPRWFERYDAAASSLALGRRACSVAVGAAVGWLPSACLVARTAVLRDLGGPQGGAGGGFDASMRVGEDVDLVWRLLEAGWRVRYDPTFEVRHDVRDSLRSILGRKVLYGTGSAPLAARHGDAVAVARLTPLMAAAGAGVLLRRPWSLALSVAATWWARRSVRRALPPFDDQSAVATRLALRGLGWSVRQESALLLRHWWPAAVLAGAVSGSARRMLLSACVVDAVVAHTLDRPLDRPDLPPAGLLGTLVGRRLDDLAYGTGVWLGAARSGSTRALRATLVRSATASPTRPRGQ